MKIYFLLMMIGVFVGLSYIPIRDRGEAKSRGAARFRASVMPNA